MFRILSQDLHTIDLEFLMYGGTNITGLRMVRPDFALESLPSEGPMLLGSALVYDAVQLFAHALTSMSDANITTVHPLNCSAEDSWAHGYTLINFMKAVRFNRQGIYFFISQNYKTLAWVFCIFF